MDTSRHRWARLSSAVLLLAAALVGTAAPAHADGDGWGVVYDGSSLAQLSLTDGEALALDAGGGSDLVEQLAAQEGLAFDPEQLAAQAREAALAKLRAAEAERLAKARRAGAQSTVDAQGCPTSAPPNTLRDGAEELGVHDLCVDSVAQAATAEAAGAVKVALGRLGAPYSQPRRNSDGNYDCSSFVTRAYAAVGVPVARDGTNAPTTHSLLPHGGWAKVSWSVEIDERDARPGDLVFPFEGHVAMVLADGFLVHTNRTGDVSHVRGAYRDPLAYRRIDPQAAARDPWGR